MIPKQNDDLQKDFEIEEKVTKTYYLDIDKNRINGKCSGITAIKQTIYKILNTERFDYIIYSWNYGIEFKNLYGENRNFVIPELERVIKEALQQDDRVIDITNFEFKYEGKSIIVTFNVKTNIGDISIEKVVSI